MWSDHQEDRTKLYIYIEKGVTWLTLREEALHMHRITQREIGNWF